MARPRKNAPPDQFTSTEVAAGGGLTPRNFSLLQEEKLAPKPMEGIGGKAGARVWDTFGVSHCALIGALHKGGLELLLAAKLAALFADEFGSAYGFLPSRLDAYLAAPLNPNPSEAPWTKRPEDKEMRADIRDDFWLHHFLRTRSAIYRPGVRMRGDFVLEIADRQYVFINGVRDYGIKYVGGKDAEPSYRIIAWERGSKAEVRSIADEVGVRFGTPEADERLNAIETEFLAARENAVGLLQINISLAIRNALDAIHDHRVATGASIDWTATAKPPPGRYDGCDENGYPLDPNHPWNKDLPPLERAKRLLEIEEYIAKREATEKQEGDTDTS